MKVNFTAQGLKPLIQTLSNLHISTDTYDDTSLNPHGRDVTDCSERRVKLLSCKHYLNVATMNVRTIRLKSKQLELVNNCESKSISILGIVDHKIVHENREAPVLFQSLGKYTLITTSAWRNTNNSAAGGVGLLLDRKAENALAEVNQWNNRIIVAQFIGSGFPALTVIVHYSPVEGSDAAEEHYNNLLEAISDTPKHNVLLVLGDFNAHLGEDTVKYTYHKNTNRNGEIVKDLVSEAGLVVTNSHFQKKRGKLWTFISDMNGSKTQVDFIMINKKWKNSVKNCEAYSSFGSIGSDHRVVTARLKLSLRTSKAPRRAKFDWKVLHNQDTRDEYTLEVKNRYGILSVDGESATEAYEHFIQANKETAKQVIPQRKRLKRKQYSDDVRVQNARNDVNYMFSKYQSDPSNFNHENLQKSKSNLQEAYDLAIEEELSEMIDKVEACEAEGSHGQSWKLINEVTGRKPAKKGVLKGNSKEDRLKKWQQYFSDLLGKEPIVAGDPNVNIPTVLQNLNIESGPFSKGEYVKVKNRLTLGKAAGPDEVSPEILKLCDFDDIMLSFSNSLFLGDKPEQWSIGNLIPIPKSGDLSEYSNYRGIMLTDVAAKITNKMILNRIQPKIDTHLRPNQNGFRPGRSTTAHVLALRRLIEGVKSNNLKAIITFVDFRKAFDSIHRGKMMKILRAYDIPDELVRVISKLYENTRATVLTPEGETEFFDIIAGVLQGDTLAPYLFAIVLDYVMREAIGDKEPELGFEIDKRKSRRHPAIFMCDLDFADDIALLSEEIVQAQELLARVEQESSKVGLYLNEKKTEVMAYNQDGPVNIITQCGKSLKVVNNFKYLGSWMESSQKDFEIRKALAWSSCHKLKKIWTSTLSRKIKVRLFLSTIESVLLYGCDTWTLTKSLEKKLNGCYTRLLRMSLNISWKLMLTNEQLYQELPQVADKVAERRMKLSGHCFRHPELCASSLVFWQPTKGSRGRGRPAATYIDNLRRDTGLEEISEIKSLMQNRRLWSKQSRLVRAGARIK